MKKRIAAAALAILAVSGLQAAVSRRALEPYVYKENFESRELNAWASYPLWQDTAFDPNIRPDMIVAGNPNFSLVERVTPYAPVASYAGAQKALDAWFGPGSSVSLKIYLKTELPAEFVKIRLAAGEKGAMDFTVAGPRTNAWLPLTATYEDFIKENPALQGGDFQIHGLAVLVKFPKGDPAMPIYFGLDDIIVKAEKGASFRFAEPAVDTLSEWKPSIPRKPYLTGDTLVVRGQWPFDAQRVGLTLTDFAEGKKSLYAGDLVRKDGEWRGAVKLAFPPGLYSGRLTAYAGAEPIAESEFTVHIVPAGTGGKHPRLWFDGSSVTKVKARLAEDRFKAVRDGILADLKDSREKLFPDKVVFDVDAFPADEPLIGNVPRSIYPWFTRITAWEKALRSSALAYALCGDEEAGAYGKAVLLKLCAFPSWVHPWFETRGQHIYYPVGELSMEAALAYDLFYGLMSEPERRACRDAFLRNMILGCHRGYVEDNLVTSSTSNWIAHVTGGSLTAQAAVFGDGPAAANQELLFTGAVLKLEDLIKKSVGRDGGYGESLGYCQFTMLSLSKALPALDNVFGLDLSAPLLLTYPDMIWAGLIKDKLFFHYGDSGGSLGPITSGAGTLGPLTNWAWLLAKRPDPMLAWLYAFLKKDETFQDVLHETAGLARKDPFAENPVRLFRDIGTTVFKSGWERDDFAFVMRTGAFFNHQHLDQGSFWLADRGVVFIGERTGSHYYDDPFYQSHYTQPVAHSTILLDHNPQSQRNGDPLRFIDGFADRAFVREFLDGKTAAFSSGDIGRLYWGKAEEMRRGALYLKPRAVLMIDTIVPAEKDVDVTLLFQSSRLEDIRPSSRESLVVKGGSALHIAHLAPEGVAVTAEKTPIYTKTLAADNPLTPEGMLTVTARTQGRPLVMASLLRIDAADRGLAQAKPGDGFVEGEIDGWRYAVDTDLGRPFASGGFTTDALALAWRPEAIFAVDARTLIRGGRTLLESTEPMTIELLPAGLTGTLMAPAKVSLSAAARPAAVTVNGKPFNSFDYDKRSGRLTMSLPAGDIRVVFQENR
ncbi:MAG: heparinase II/III family protein [Candidatus Aminicenantes bacterium]|nr:heparinase II/III family protein [Candidatus Aminicenantes bacterium]